MRKKKNEEKKTALEPVEPAKEPVDTSSISDGHHTFRELYEHRNLLFVALMKSHPRISWRANNHHDGSSYEGWFIAGMHLPVGDISYHLPVAFWEFLDGAGITTSNCAPEWDGHTPQDVVDRLSRCPAWARSPDMINRALLR